MENQELYDCLVKHIVENQTQFYRAAYSYVKNREAALDVVQNATLKALEHYDKLQSIEAMASWFYRIVINEALMYLRKEKKYIAWDETESDLLEGSYEEPAYEPKIEVVSKLSELPTEMQIIIQLHFFEEKTLKDIAEITQTNLNTVKSRLYAACKKLGKELELEDQDLVTRNKKAKEKQEKKEQEKAIREKTREARSGAEQSLWEKAGTEQKTKEKVIKEAKQEKAGKTLKVFNLKSTKTDSLASSKKIRKKNRGEEA